MTLTRIAAGLLLAALGCFMSSLALSRAYWLFLNPRFSWLTLGAGILLAVLGISLALERGRRVSLPACLVLLAFLPLAWLAAMQAEDGGLVPAGLSASAVADAGPPTVRHGGVDYIRLNPAELLTLADRTEGPDERPFATEGFVLRSPAMDAAGEIAVARLVITCCFADALAAGVRVRVADPAALPDGAWVRVAGRLQRVAPPSGNAPSVPGVIATVLAESAAFIPDAVERISEPEQPYVFEIRSSEPFAY